MASEGQFRRLERMPKVVSEGISHPIRGAWRMVRSGHIGYTFFRTHGLHFWERLINSGLAAVRCSPARPARISFARKTPRCRFREGFCVQKKCSVCQSTNPCFHQLFRPTQARKCYPCARKKVLPMCSEESVTHV